MGTQKQNGHAEKRDYLPTRLFSGTYEPLKNTLIPMLIAEGMESPLQEKIVLVPSNFVGEELAGRLAKASEKPLIHIRFLTLIDLAKTLLARRGIHVRVADGTARAVVLAHILARHASTHGENCTFSRVAGKKGVVGALLRFFDSLEEACVGKIEALHLSREKKLLSRLSHPETFRELLELYGEFTESLESGGFATRTSLVRKTIETFETPSHGFRVKVFGFYDFTPLQWFFVEKLIASGLCDDLFIPIPLKGLDPGLVSFENPGDVLEKVPDFASYAKPTLLRLLHACAGNITIVKESEETAKTIENLSGISGGEGETLPFLLVEAPHEQGELNVIARIISSRNGGDTSTAIIYRNLTESISHTAEKIFREHSLPGEILWGKPLLAFPQARLLTSLLHAFIDGFPRSRVIDILTSPVFSVEKLLGREPEHPGWWDTLSKRAGVLKGDDWDLALSRFTASVETYERYREEEEGEGDEDAKAMKSSAISLRDAVHRLREILAPLGDVVSFRELTRLLTSFLETYVLVKGEPAHAVEQERATLRLVEILERLRTCEESGVPFPGIERSAILLETVLEDERIPIHTPGSIRRGRGIIVGDVVSLRGLAFDEVYIASANEGYWPSLPGGDPVFREEEKRIIRDFLEKRGIPRAMTTHAEEAESERLLFSLPFISGGRVAGISYLRTDMAGKKKVPSPFLLSLLSSYVGPRVFATGISEETFGKKFVSVPRTIRGSLSLPGNPSRKEMVIAAIFSPETSPAPPPIRGCAYRMFRKAADSVRKWYHGETLFPHPSKARSARIPRGDLNHTLLDNLTKCPFRTYLRYAVRLSPLSEPEEVLSVSRRELGIIAHRALHIVYREAARGTSIPSPEDAVRQAVEDVSGKIPLGLRGLISIASREIAEKIRRLMEIESTLDEDWAPSHLEIEFGGTRSPRVVVETKNGPVTLSGKIDRIDVGKSGIRIVDYKYSKGSGYKKLEEKVERGVLNQVPIYAIAARSIVGGEFETSPVLGGYIFLEAEKEKEMFRFVEISRDGRIFEGWIRSLELMFESLTSGSFPPLPDDVFNVGGSPMKYCEYCDFRELCRVSPHLKGVDRAKEELRDAFGEITEGMPWHRQNREPS